MTLADRIRELVTAAGNAGLSVAEMRAELAPHVPADQAERAAARLARAGRANPDGVRRVIQDRCNVLLTRGELTARGDGDDRRYFPADPTQEPKTMLPRPKAKREVVPLERLTFDPRLQQRAGLGDKGYDESTVTEYVTARTELGAELPPLKAVWDEPEQTFWVYGGYHTGECLRRCGAVSAEVMVTEGTFEDAELYSLAENAGHGKARTNADKQKALSTLLGNKKLLARVLAESGDEGGTHRAIASACQVSKGMVYTALQARGLKVTRTGDVVKATPKPTEPTPPPAPGEKKPSTPAPETTARAKPDSDTDADDRDDEPEASPAPGESDDEPATEVPEWIATAVGERAKFDKLIAVLTTCLHELDKTASGPGGTFLRKVIGEDGEAFVREMKVRRGQATTFVYTVPPLLWLVRLLKRSRPEKVCGGCAGLGCRCCRDAGFLPANLDLLPVAGETGDLFSADELRDVWDS